MTGPSRAARPSICASAVSGASATAVTRVSTGRAGAAKPSRADDGEASGGQPGDGELETIDVADAIDRVGGDRSFLIDLYREFSAGLDDQIEDVKAKVNDGDLEAVRAVAHTLKGAAANLGAVGLAKAALALEQACRAARAPAAGEAVRRLEKVSKGLPRALAAAGLEVKT